MLDMCFDIRTFPLTKQGFDNSCKCDLKRLNNDNCPKTSAMENAFKQHK